MNFNAHSAFFLIAGTVSNGGYLKLWDNIGNTILGNTYGTGNITINMSNGTTGSTTPS
jgi:hypothetical protein